MRCLQPAVINTGIAALAWLLLSLPAASVKAAESQAMAPRYRITSLGALQGARSVTAEAINSQGMVTGNLVTQQGAQLPFLWQNGRMNFLPSPPNAQVTAAYGLNDFGDVAGVLQTDLPHALVWKHDGKFLTFGNFDENGSFARAINNAGQVAGDANGNAFFHDGRSTRILSVDVFSASTTFAGMNNSGAVLLNASSIYAFNWGYVYKNGQFTQLSAQDELMVFTAINDRGQVASYTRIPSGGSHADENAYIITDGVRQKLEKLGGSQTTIRETFDMNNQGWLLGELDRGQGAESFLYREGRMYAFNELLQSGASANWHSLSVRSLNDAGQIVGFGAFGPSGQTRAFIATPVPEPHGYWLMLAGLGMIAAFSNRRGPVRFA